MSNADSTTVEAAFISANAASYIASTYTATIKGSQPLTLTLDTACLRTLNAFLDYFLAIIIKDARSTDLHDLKATLARVLDSALGFVALNEAQAELETYRNQESASGAKFDWPRTATHSTNKTADFDVEAVWLQARIRCMIYSTVGEKEESDFPSLDALENSVTPPVAIFLTAILEFLGEHILLTAARFARERLGSAKKGVLIEDDLDCGVRLDKVLATIWQSYLTILPSHAGLRKKASRDTISSTPDRILTTLPFSQTAPAPNYPRNLPASTSQTTSQALPPLTTDLHHGDYSEIYRALPELESLQAIPETTATTTDSITASKLGTPARKVSMDVSPLVPTKSNFTETSEQSGSAGRLRRTASNASSLYVSGQDTPDVAAPLASTGGLWSNRRSDAADGATAEQKTLWQRPGSDSKPVSTHHHSLQGQESMTSSLPTATTAARASAPLDSADGFESGVYRYNVQRDSSTALNTVSPQQEEEKNVKAAMPTAPATNGAKSPFRAVYESIYAEQMALENANAPKVPAKDAARRQSSELPEEMPSPGVQKTATLQTRKPVQIRQVVPKLAPAPLATKTARVDPVQGLGIRDVSTSNMEPGSDYEAFIQSEMARSRGAVDNQALSEAERRAQRARILANRAAAIASQNSSSRQASPVLGKSPPPPATSQSPVFAASTPPAGLYSPGSPTKRRISRSTPRAATTSAEPSQTLLLAEFLRNTGPERSTPRAVPLMSVASPKSTTNRDPFSTLSSPQIKPVKATKAEMRAPIDSSGTDDQLGDADDDDDDDDDDAESWDEELYGPRPGASRGESMTDFLKNVPPPKEMLREAPVTGPSGPQSPKAISRQRNASSPRPPRTPKQSGGTGPGGGDDDEDTLIAGPAYSSPIQANTTFMPESSRTPTKSTTAAVQPGKLHSPVTKTTLGRTIEKPVNGANGAVGAVTGAALPGAAVGGGAAGIANATLFKATSSRPGSGNLQPRGARLSSSASPPGNTPAGDRGEDLLSDDESIYGHPRRRPAKKESLAEFLKYSVPPGYEQDQRHQQQQDSAAPFGAQESSSSSSTGLGGGALSKMGRRISSLSILVGGGGGGATRQKAGNGNGNGNTGGESSPTTATNSPSRPNHRPLVP